MQRNQRILFYALILIAAAAWIAMGATPPGQAEQIISQPAPHPGLLAPDFTLMSLEGKRYALSELRGKPVLINLWATWCPPCRAEMPALESIYQEYKDRGLIILAVNMTYQDEPMNMKDFVTELNLIMPILLDPTGEVARLYQLRSLPSSYFIDRHGTIDDVVIGGPMPESLIRTRIEKIIE